MSSPKREGVLHKGGGDMETTMMNEKALLPLPLNSTRDFELFPQPVYTLKCLSPLLRTGKSTHKIVLVCLGCYNKIAQIGSTRNNKKLFRMVLETGKSKMKVTVWLSSAEGPLPGSEPVAFCWVLKWWMGQKDLCFLEH